MKKRILAAVLTAVMAMGALTGCGSTAGKDNYTIGIMQYAVHGSLDNCREGFIQGLAEEGIVEGENLTIEYVNAQADNGTSAMTASNFVSKKVVRSRGLGDVYKRQDLCYRNSLRYGSIQCYNEYRYSRDLHCSI